MGSRIKALVWPQGVTVAAFVVALGVVASFDRVHAPPPDLFAAIQDNDVATVRQALAKGVSANQTDPFGFYPLNLAISRGNAQIAELLIDAGASVRQVDAHGMDALLQATLSSKPEILQLLIDRGAPLVNPGRRHDLLTVAAVMNADLVKVLLRGGADPNHPSADGITPLHYARESDSPESVRLLLAAGAKDDPNVAQASPPKLSVPKTRHNLRVTHVAFGRPIPRFLRRPRLLRPL